MISLFTFTGIPYDRLPKALDEKLDSKAYKKFSTGSFSGTDIGTGWTVNRLNEIFGINGLGWGLDVNSADIECVEGTTKSGKANYTVVVRLARFWYQLCDEKGTPSRFYVSCTGASTNLDKGFAYRGAFTNAAGMGAGLIGYQNHIYKDLEGPEEEVDETPSDGGSAPERASKPKISAAVPEGGFANVGEFMTYLQNNGVPQDRIKVIREDAKKDLAGTVAKWKSENKQ